MEEWVNLISTLGFPIVTAVAMFYFGAKFINEQMLAATKREEALLQESTSREERYAVQIERFTETLNNFNITLTKIDARLEALEKTILKGEVE